MKRFVRAGCVALVAYAAFAASPAAETAQPGFAPPAPGTYKLEHIMRAPDGEVLDSDGSVHRLSEFSTGKITLFSFIYTYCTDAKGCPLAYQTLRALKKRVAQDPALRGKVRFVSMSFDPQFDTHQAMRSYGGDDARDTAGVRWHFLTTASSRQLAPLLDGFGQDVSMAAPQGPNQRVPTLSHMLKVYLLDSGASVREIYSTSFLQQQVLENDIKTLLLERAARRKQAAAPRAPRRFQVGSAAVNQGESMNTAYQISQPERAEIDAMAGIVALDFGTDWCGFCKAAAPAIESALAGQATVRHVKVEDGPGRALGRSFRIKLWPTVIILKDGRECARAVRPGDSAAVLAALQAAL